MTTPPGIDRSRWPQLSARLDDLLDLEPAERPARLEALRAEDPALADELARWLARLDDEQGSGFMAAPARVDPTAAGAAEAGESGRQVGAYELERELGRGGMGSVWLARRTDGRYEGRVAIKFLQASLYGLAAGERFGREGRILGRLDHPHIARLLDAGHLGGDGPGAIQPYLVLEYVDGEPIDHWCDRRAPTLEDRLHLVLDVLAAVEHAHNRLILHRDLKPSNILVTEAGQVKLLDFGIAKLLDDAEAPTAAGELTRRAGSAFTPAYAAPEQRVGGDVTTATDVYALGVLLYRLLAGRLPTEGTTLVGAAAAPEPPLPRLSDAARRCADPVVRRFAPALRGDLDTIAAKALKSAPAERYANAAELAADLRRHLAHEPIQARPDRWTYRSARFLRRHRVGVGASAVVVAALVTGAVVAWVEAREAQQQQAQAEGLIEFMLGDLRERLKPVGRLDALDAVGERALAYYAAQDPARLDAASLGRRSRALHLLGEIEEQRGRLDEAARRFDEAEASTAALLALHPDDPQRLFDHSQSAYWVGFIARRRGLHAQAEAAFGRYLALAQALVRRQPAVTDWRVELAYAGQNLGVLQLEAGDAARALRSFEQTQAAWDSTADARPDLAIERANTLGWIAEAHEALNDSEAAIAAQRAKLAVLGRMPDAARNREAQFLVANAHGAMSLMHLALGRLDDAEAEAATAVHLAETLADVDPANQLWRSELATLETFLAECRLAQGRVADARAVLAVAGNRVQALLALPEPNQRVVVNLQGRWLALRAQVADGAGERDAARQALVSWLGAMAQREAQGRALDARQARIAAVAGLAGGDLLDAAGDGSAARAAWTDAERRLQPGLARGEWPARALAGLLAFRLGRTDDAQAASDMLRATMYRHPDVASLSRALSVRPRP